MNLASPLRYPGGKAALASLLCDTIDLNDLRGCSYYEPYAGGAGAALSLLREEVVCRLHLNDADERVYCFWRAALFETARFVERVMSVPLDMDEWRKQQRVCLDPGANQPFDVGFSAFYMNRCNRSGVLTGAGPIGGYEQKGEWRMDVRFNRVALAERLTALSAYRDVIRVSNMDAVDFLKQCLPRGEQRRKAFVYLDPPYVQKGQRLYLNAYEKRDHLLLARYMARQNVLPWLMSYDDSELVRRIYRRHCKMRLLPTRYTLQAKRVARELIVFPNHVAIPQTCRGNGGSRPLEPVQQGEVA